MKKFPRVQNLEERLGYEAVAQEKLDGSNFRFWLEEHMDEEYQTDSRELVFGSRNVEFKNRKDENSQFEDPISYVREVVNPADVRQAESEVGGALVFFGEAMVPNHLDYDWENTPDFIGFDIYNLDEGEFLPPERVRSVYELLGLEVSPQVDTISPGVKPEDIDIPQSNYADHKAEGLVLKNPESPGKRHKIVSEDFREVSPNPTPSEDDTSELYRTYFTDQRIRETAFQLVCDGKFEEVSIAMMGELPHVLVEDVFNEEAQEIVMENDWVIDTERLRKKLGQELPKILRGTEMPEREN